MLEWITHYGPALRIVFDMVTVSIAAVAAVRGLTIVRVIFNAAHTAAKIEDLNQRNVELIKERNDLKSSLDAAVAGHDGWKAAVETLGFRMEKLKESTEADLTDLKQKLALAANYIAELLQYISHLGTPPIGLAVPVIPSELQEDLNSLMVKKQNGKETNGHN